MAGRPMKYALSSCGSFPFRSHLLYERLKGQTWIPGPLSEPSAGPLRKCHLIALQRSVVFAVVPLGRRGANQPRGWPWVAGCSRSDLSWRAGVAAREWLDFLPSLAWARDESHDRRAVTD